MKMIFKIMTKQTMTAVVFVAIWSGAQATARADRRAYGETYEAVTAPKGELDVEVWSTYARLGEVDGGPAGRGVREMVELEYGVTDKWDVALYNMLDAVQTGGDSGYAGFKIETRYRPLYHGQWFVDPVLYLELQQLFRGDADQKLEAKLIVAKDIGRLNLAVNLAFEGERLSSDHSIKPEVEYAAGASYELGPAWKLGAEVFGKAEKDDTGDVKVRTWVGPALSWATSTKGALRGLWITVAGGAALTSDSDAFYGRMIVGLQF